MTATVIIILILLVICIFAVRSFILKTTRGCCGSAADTVKRIEKSADGMPYLCVVEIGGMTCRNCSARIENTFNRMEGYAVEVSLKDGTARIHTSAEPSELEIRRIICGLGYTVGEIIKQ